MKWIADQKKKLKNWAHEKYEENKVLGFSIVAVIILIIIAAFWTAASIVASVSAMVFGVAFSAVKGVIGICVFGYICYWCVRLYKKCKRN